MRRSGVARRLSEARLVWDLFRSQREGAPGLARRQQARLAALVTHARAASRFYQRRYRDHAVGAPLRDLPPVTKPALMAAFDDWVTDPRVMRAAVEAFIADPARLGARLCDAYFVCSTSGTTGVPGRFVHDAHAVAVYRALSVRMFGAWWSPAGAWALARKGGRLVAVVGTGGHFAGEGWAESERRRDAVRAHAYSVISVQRPLAEIVATLNDRDPAVLIAYPSALALLASRCPRPERRPPALSARCSTRSMSSRASCGPSRVRAGCSSPADRLPDRIRGKWAAIRSWNWLREATRSPSTAW